MTEITVRLATLAVELNRSVDELADSLSPNLILRDAAGFRCVEHDVATKLLDEHMTKQAHQQRKQEARQQRRTALGAQNQSTRDRVPAIRQQQEELRASGVITEGAPAHAVMASADHNARMDRAGATFDELMAAQRAGQLGTMTRIEPH